MARRAILPVSLHYIVMLAKAHTPDKHFTISVDNHGLPEDAHIVGYTDRWCFDGHDYPHTGPDQMLNGTIGLIVESRSFADIGYGQPYPVLESPTFTQHWHDASPAMLLDAIEFVKEAWMRSPQDGLAALPYLFEMALDNAQKVE